MQIKCVAKAINNSSSSALRWMLSFSTNKNAIQHLQPTVNNCNSIEFQRKKKKKKPIPHAIHSVHWQFYQNRAQWIGWPKWPTQHRKADDKRKQLKFIYYKIFNRPKYNGKKETTITTLRLSLSLIRQYIHFNSQLMLLLLLFRYSLNLIQKWIYKSNDVNTVDYRLFIFSFRPPTVPSTLFCFASKRIGKTYWPVIYVLRL